MIQLKIDYLVYGLLALALVGVAYTVYSMFQPLPDNGTTYSTVASSVSTVSTGTTGQGDVQIDLTPVGIKNKQFFVNIAANTHSVDLSQFDLTKLTTLEYEGKVIETISAPKLSGHHSSGELIFEVDKEIKVFKIKIKGIPSVEERVFEWK